MKLQIKNDTKIKDLQKKFTEAYSFLKLEFYKKQHAEKELSVGQHKISPEKIISEQTKFFKPGNIDISNQRTVAEFEKDFYDKFHIAVQVSRRSGNIWIETSLTDDRTLETQNRQGEESSVPFVAQDYEDRRMDVR